MRMCLPQGKFAKSGVAGKNESFQNAARWFLELRFADIGGADVLKVEGLANLLRRMNFFQQERYGVLNNPRLQIPSQS